MAKDVIEFDGEVLEVLAAGNYRIKLLEGMDNVVVMGYLAGKMRKFSINIIMGDRVKVELNEYDPMKSRIVYRYRPGENRNNIGQVNVDATKRKKEEKIAKLKEQEGTPIATAPTEETPAAAQ